MPTPLLLTSPGLRSRTSLARRWLVGSALGVLAVGGLAAEAALAPVTHSLSVDAAPSTEGGLRDRVLGLLEHSPLEEGAREQWRELGTGAVPILAELAKSHDVPSERRALAVASLAVVAPPQGADTIGVLLADPHAPSEVRASAAAALGRSLGLEATSPLLAQLQDRDARVRTAVAQALGRLGGQEVRQALEDQVALEESAQVREALQRSLTLTEP
ncbi:HEAT repeat domain-containing protein [Corallococcus sp. M34]|uniref:HEAT repeat domain-containing protein n=1 Tax=Citreicoccus inhibens TaxID=2849499 RepID=UPI001C21A841|nr:HEAT repeat domain-containing protein [Citreicoccus inhibens]MBU8900061.1 HEAT repeat domain-containing protein [Citreicoccus inhibens]